MFSRKIILITEVEDMYTHVDTSILRIHLNHRQYPEKSKAKYHQIQSKQLI